MVLQYRMRCRLLSGAIGVCIGVCMYLSNVTNWKGHESEGSAIGYGAWGYGIFDNDDALDIRDRFRRLVREGLPMEEVTKRCVEDYPDPMNDVAVVLALAALQMEQKQLQPETKQRALQMIEEKKDIATWNDPEKRKQALEAFRQKLLRD